MAFLIVAMIPLAWWANELERGPRQSWLFGLHFSVGAVILILLAVRMFHRAVHPRASHVPELGLWHVRAARAVHLLLYLAMMLMLGSGYLIQIHMQSELSLFGLVDIPRPFDPGGEEGLRVIAWYLHTYGQWLLLGLAAAHAGAALWHHFVRRDSVMHSMLPHRLQ